MKLKMTSMLMGAMLMLAVTLSAATPAAAPERHPNIRRAIGALENAKNDLEHADHDFGGHRAEAIEAVNHAIEQLRVAVKYDRD